ncbi:MAG: cytochrome d ubiquinol oxidase subunit II [Muribaculaceae bacterium]|nr:cytochrome d ubiquinol oxidase subunit II [Muribaculaceae bacterium]
METYNILQNYWWFIISVLGAVLVFLLLVQGGQSLLVHHRDVGERSLLVKSLGRKWELTFTTLVTFGGAFFASFPLFYSTSFGGAYWLWMLILFSFVVQAISYEYRTKQGNVYGRRFYDALLLVNGVVGPVLLGVAVAGMFFGAEFTVTKSNLLDVQSATISTWGPLHGLEAIASWRNLLFGVMLFFLARTLASLYFINNINDAAVSSRQRVLLSWNAPAFVVLFLAVVAVLLTSRGVAVDESGNAQWVAHKYLTNYLEMWWALVTLVAGVGLVLFGIGRTLMRRDYTCGIWPAGAGTLLVVLSLFWVLGYNGTAYYPSLLDAQSSLTLRNSASSEFTLTVMSVVSVLVPFVVGYIAWCWFLMDRGGISRNEE